MGENTLTLLRSTWFKVINLLSLSMSKKKELITKRVITFKHSDSSLTSKRVSIILSSPIDSKKLAKAVRALRHNGKGNSTFQLTPETEGLINEESLKLQQA